MKPIDKQPEPKKFATWKSQHPGANYKDDLCGPDPKARAAKKALKTSLLQEQKYLCCYCECRIDANHSHIEHFKPKGIPAYSSLQLNYENLHASCSRQPTGVPEEHCGHKKGDVFSNDLISPMASDCASHFGYRLDGSIEGLDDKGKATIRILHLDSALLDSQRKTLIDHFLDLDDTQMASEIASHLNTGHTKLGEFYSMIEYLRQTHQL